MVEGAGASKFLLITGQATINKDFIITWFTSNNLDGPVPSIFYIINMAYAYLYIDTLYIILLRCVCTKNNCFKCIYNLTILNTIIFLLWLLIASNNSDHLPTLVS